jgi:hypothetical protein
VKKTSTAKTFYVRSPTKKTGISEESDEIVRGADPELKVGINELHPVNRNAIARVRLYLGTKKNPQRLEH